MPRWALEINKLALGWRPGPDPDRTRTQDQRRALCRDCYETAINPEALWQLAIAECRRGLYSTSHRIRRARPQPARLKC